MAKNQPLLKKTRMPPKRPSTPKSPVMFNYRSKLKAESIHRCHCVDGPLKGQLLSMMPSRPHTIVFTLNSMTGRYVCDSSMMTATWEPV